MPAAHLDELVAGRQAPVGFLLKATEDVAAEVNEFVTVLFETLFFGGVLDLDCAHRMIASSQQFADPARRLARCIRSIFT